MGIKDSIYTYISIFFSSLFSNLYPIVKNRKNAPSTIFYESYLTQSIIQVMDALRKKHVNFDSWVLPKNFGHGLSERIIEIPWVLSHLENKKGNHLDAGSSLNFYKFLKHNSLQNKKIFISNLNPERYCFWWSGVSYIFEDLRGIIYRECYFDSISCISVLEHVGMDNSRYLNESGYIENIHSDYLKVVKEFRRVLKTGGSCYITVPFGAQANLEWLQVFTPTMVDSVIKQFKPRSYNLTFYKYTSGSWVKSTMQGCSASSYSVAYKAKEKFVGAGAVCCMELRK